MRIINFIALTLVIVGALNWLLVGAFSYNLVDALFGPGTIFTRIVYVLVGVAGLWSICFYSKLKED